jgi:hypothetical protein
MLPSKESGYAFFIAERDIYGLQRRGRAVIDSLVYQCYALAVCAAVRTNNEWPCVCSWVSGTSGYLGCC